MTQKWIYIRKQIMKNRLCCLLRTELDKIECMRYCSNESTAVQDSTEMQETLFMEHRKETKENSFKTAPSYLASYCIFYIF